MRNYIARKVNAPAHIGAVETLHRKIVFLGEFDIAE